VAGRAMGRPESRSSSKAGVISSGSLVAPATMPESVMSTVVGSPAPYDLKHAATRIKRDDSAHRMSFEKSPHRVFALFSNR
jgi:hypothetical protein